MGGSTHDMSGFSVRHLRYLARHGDEDAKAELKRRMDEDVARYEQAKADAKGNGAE
jgi:hypothetical protein